MGWQGESGVGYSWREEVYLGGAPVVKGHDRSSWCSKKLSVDGTMGTMGL